MTSSNIGNIVNIDDYINDDIDIVNVDVTNVNVINMNVINNLIIFDWDDTLFATTSIGYNECDINDKKFSTELENNFIIISEIVLKILEKAIKYYKVVIITNAEIGWVEFSSQKLIPDVLKFIQEHNIDIISARAKYSNKVNNHLEWKTHTFQDLLDSFGNIKLNVTSFGDNISERMALKNLNGTNIALKKSIKFIETPTIKNLINELRLILESFDQIITCTEDLDIMLTLTEQ
jgi:hypothetical protein